MFQLVLEHSWHSIALQLATCGCLRARKAQQTVLTKAVGFEPTGHARLSSRLLARPGQVPTPRAGTSVTDLESTASHRDIQVTFDGMASEALGNWSAIDWTGTADCVQCCLY